MSNKEHPIVFISYARTNPKYQEKIVNFANTLRGNGIDAKLDELELKIGHDLYYFMEQNIKEDADFILLMLNKEFVEKANKREGGVGTETQIIAKDVYDNTQQEKIIPIILEYNKNGKPYLPTFIESRYCIDLSSDEKYSENYELLLRTLYNEPKNLKEELGEKPKWLDEKNVYYSKTSSIIKRFDYQVETHPERFNFMIEEFFSEYLEYLKTFKIKFINNNINTISKEFYENLENYELLKNDLTTICEKMFKVGKYEKINCDIIIDFLTNISSLVTMREIGETYNIYEFVGFDFILREIFLYFIAFGLKYKNYNLIGDLLHSPYYLNNKYGESMETKHFVNLDHYSGYANNLLNNYNKNEKNKSQTSLGEFLLKRIPSNLNKEFLIDADLLCCYVSYMEYNKFKGETWFPFTLIYKQRNMPYDLFRRLTSKRFFESVKPVFNVDNIEEFKQKVISTRNMALGKCEITFTHRVFGYVKPIEEYINLDEICIER